jgi:hypothetical protein
VQWEMPTQCTQYMLQPSGMNILPK